MMQPVPFQEREYRETLYRIERRAIIPLKWVVLLVTVGLWHFISAGNVGVPVFLLFFLYSLCNLALMYFFYFAPYNIHRIKPLTLLSYLADVVFVSMLIYFDLATPYFGPDPHHDFYLLYFLLVMRGFALFKTIAETIIVNFLISTLYILTVYLQRLDLAFIFEPDFLVQLILIWLVILMTWFIVMIITKQKMELMDVHEKLLRADSLARVGELAAGVAHEINNPISIIATTADYLQRYDPSPEELRQEISMIQNEAMRCKEIVQQMLTYARPRAAGKSAVDPVAINDEVLTFVFPGKRADRCQVERDYASPIPLIEADPNLVKQALLNLYINARQAIPKDRPGRIIARIQPEHGQRAVRFEVIDNGIGIPEDDLEHIFDPFFTRKAEGTGLGLAITQRIIETSGGSISVRPNSPAGTVISFTLPASKK